jgi:serine/threonine-protein kinase
MSRTPDALRDRAGDIARRFGDDVSPRSVEWWVDLDDGYAAWSFEHPRAASIATVRPAALRFNYRQSPGPLTATRSSRTSRNDPVPSLTGEAYVALDPEGRLLGFSRLARQVAPDGSSPSGDPNWEPLLALTGLDVGRLQSAQPLWTPDVASDSRAAWTLEETGTTVRIEAAAWRGQPVWLRTIAPWSRPERDAPSHPVWYTGFVFFVALVIAILVAFSFLARYNLRLGRGDPRGALKVALAVFVAFGLAGSLFPSWSFEPGVIWRWLWRQPYFPAFIAWVMYLGIEPYVRRRWPHRLVAWTRLLDGRFRDPLVGRELLLGLLMAAAIVAVTCLPAIFEPGHDVELLVVTLPFGRAASFWAAIADGLGEGIMKGLGTFAFFLLQRVIFRRDSLAWLATGAVWVLASIPSPHPSALQWLSIAMSAACTVLVARAGVLAAVTALGLAGVLAITTPLTLDFSRWYAWRTGMVWLLLLAVALWGFRAVMGRRRILSAAVFDA